MNIVVDRKTEDDLHKAFSLAGPFLLGLTGMALNLIFIMVGKSLTGSTDIVFHLIGSLLTYASYVTFIGSAILAIIKIRQMTQAVNLLTAALQKP